MSLVSLAKIKNRTGVIIDVGSGSVLVAVVISNPRNAGPEILWSHREQAPLRIIESIEQSSKSVMTSLVNALLKFDSEGRRALQEYNGHSTVDEVQCSICAPWAYTVTKTITYTQDEPFLITKVLLDSLIESAEKSAQTELAENEAITALDLDIITRSTLDIKANGYRTPKVIGNHATDLSIAQVSVVTQQYLIDHLRDLRHKLFSDKPLHQLSYMLSLYAVVDEMYHDTSDYCLIDITYEATEIGIVRDGILTYSTHIPFGSFSLAREIAHITELPLLQSFQSLHTNDIETFLETLTKAQREEVSEMLHKYTERLTSLFIETGDSLSIPKRMYLHTELELESLFTTCIQTAVQSLLKSQASIQPLTSTLRERVTVGQSDQNKDTAMLVGAMFFHIQNERRLIEYR